MNIPKYWEYTNNNENVHFILLFSPYYWAQENEAKCDVIINHKPQLFQYIKMAHFFDARRSYVPYLFYVVSLNLIKRRY